MFRAQNNEFDDVVAKATDENLTSENWEYIMEAVDKVEATGETGARDVVAALIKRLAHRNAQVQIYTLETANALSQNCGVRVHRELSSRAFTDALLRLAGDRSTHQTVKAKILERMEDWAEMYSKDPELGIMEQAYLKLKTQNPSLHAPSKPIKSAMSDQDRQKEDEDLARALEISLQESRRDSNFASTSKSTTQTQKAPEPKPEPVPAANATAATVSRVRALYDFVPTEAGELALRKGDVIAVLESVYKDWWKGSLRGQVGIFPLNYVEKLADPTQDELQREAQAEAEVFGQIKNVERLLSMLSTSSADQNVQDNEEITKLYHQTLQIRPKLIDLISKYQQKRDELSALNEKFVKARRDYEALLDTSMSQPPQGHYPSPHGYGQPGGSSAPSQPPQGYGYPGGPPNTQSSVPGAFGPPEHAMSTLPYPDASSPGRQPAQPAQGYGVPSYPPNIPHSQTGPVPTSPGHQRITSSYHEGQPQELATAPHEQHHEGQPPPQHPQSSSQAPYQSYYTYKPPGQGGSVPYPAGQQPSSQGQQQQPQQVLPYPVITSPTTVRSSADSYQQYLNNRPPSWQDGGGNVVGGPSAPPVQGNTSGSGQPSDFYKNAELFLPGGAARSGN